MSDTRKFGSSTSFIDPAVTHQVLTSDDKFGYGIYGYYTSYIEANNVHRNLVSRGCATSQVVDHNFDWTDESHVHPLIPGNF